MLRAMGVLLAQIPESLDAQAALYRSMLAGKRMLVLIDNAADAGQVAAAAGGTGCAVLVTSRSQLTGLVAVEGAHRSSSTCCPRPKRVTAGRRLGAQRVMAEPAAATELAGLCAGLPLALSVAAARAAARPSLRCPRSPPSCAATKAAWTRWARRMRGQRPGGAVLVVGN